MTEPDFRAIFHAHKDAVYRFAFRMTGSPAEAEDASQDCFLELLKQPARYNRSRGEMRAFLLGITRNLVFQRWRSERRWDSLDGEDFAGEPVDITAGETAELVASAVRSLPPLQREALVLAEYDELSIEEIARVVEAEPGTVKARLHRARENLRRALAPLRPSATREGTWNR